MTAAREPGPTPLGVYLHVPYCRSRCHYCAFHFVPGPRSVPDESVDLLVEEVRRRAGDPRFAGRKADSVYFGGGTPSLLDVSQFSRLLEAVRACFPIAPDAEISLEANPERLESARLAGWREAGANRITLGWQSVRANHLRTLTRTHTPDDGFQALERARAAGFENVGVDLIFGVPGQHPAEWREDLAVVAAAGFEHVSAYELTLEEGTRLARRHGEGRFELADEAERVAMFEDAADVLAAHGIQRYEISNFARTGRACRHNLSAWQGGDTLGLGPSAASHVANVRWKNPVDADGPIEAETLDARLWAIEDLYLGLRTAEGVDAARRLESVPAPVRRALGAALATLHLDGLVAEIPGRLVLTARGLLFADAVFERLLEA